jgi:hypothetical protein
LAGVDWPNFAAWRNQGILRPGIELSSPASASECGFADVVCLVLRNLPDYNSDVAGIRSMYRTPDYDRDTLEQLQGELLHRTPDTQALRLLVTGMFLALTAAAIWYLLVRTFGLRAEDTVKVDSFANPGANDVARYIVYGAPAAEKRRRYFDPLPATDRLWLDLRDASAEGRIEIAASTDVIALDEFDSNLNDIEVVRRRIELLERLLREDRRVVVLFVSTEPLNFVGASHHTEKDLPLLTRLAAALARFKLTYYEPATEADRPTRPLPSVWARIVDGVRGNPARAAERPGWRRRLVAEECRHPDLREIRDDLSKQVDVHELSKAQIIQQVQNRASALYHHMWSRCTRVEKFTLMQLAHGNPINPNNWDAARRLRVRGYARTDPFYRIASESLRQFVLRMERVENVQSWRAESPGGWDQIKMPLMAVLVGTLIFLALTQPNLFNNMFAFLAAGVASFPFLVSALSARLQRSAQGGGK